MPPKTSSLAGYVSLWACNVVLALLITVRLALRKWNREAFTGGDAWSILALLFNGLRTVGDYYINKYGTPLSMAMVEIREGRHNLELSGKLSIASRVAIVVVLWSLKMAVMDILRPMLRKLRFQWFALRVIYAILGTTFLASILAVFLECDEISLNWKLFPEPEQCASGLVWIITYEISNIVTDAMLFTVLMVLLLAAPMSKWERVRLAIFGPGVVLIAVNIIRLVEGLPFTDIMFNRIVWGSAEVTIAAAVATVPAVYVLLRRDIGKQKGKRRKPCGNGQVYTATLHDSDRDPDAGGPGWQSPLHLQPWGLDFPWNSSAPTDSEGQDKTSKPTPQASFPSSTRNSTRSVGESQDRRARSKSRYSHSFQNLHPCSAVLTGDGFSGWAELNDVHARDVAEEATSPEPDNAEYEGDYEDEVAVAAEVGQEAHRLWRVRDRPQIVTIRSRREGSLGRERDLE
ncbi:hypothetical protein GGR50DRAFT_696724 [Xylaria sp. CBS 124048]|nr:hypothetical protein GGR50DRAFT_696724 [Xylaria sp. CBS 124048]